MLNSRFKPQDVVRRVSNPDIVGIVHEAHWDGQTETWTYRVRFGNSLRGVPEDELQFLPTAFDPWSTLESRSVAGARAFLELLTYERLRKPPSRIAASFGSAKAAFYPYQFKPLLKFLESPRQRMLIVDDVGLGKTIEAGYIIRELRARHELERVIIVVPARLRRKWRDELERRFSEHFEIVGVKELLSIGKALERGQEPGHFLWITSYESARDENVIELFDTLQPAIDLVVIDEAHRLRNPGTAQHKLGRALGQCADSMIMLTATPVQTGLENLFWLLNILDPVEFSDPSVFALQVNANRPVIRAITALREPNINTMHVEELLNSLRADLFTQSLTEGQYFESIIGRARNANQLTRTELVALQRDIMELSLTGHVINRTRKHDVFPERPQRRARVYKVYFTQPERQFYSAVERLCQMVRPDLDGWGFAMSVLMAYRYTASCIPAAVELFKERLGQEALLVYEEDLESDDVLTVTETRNGGGGCDNFDKANTVRQTLSQLVRVRSSQITIDSKFMAFRKALDDLWNDDRAHGRQERKVIVFSYFKRTLRYLSQKLHNDQVGHRLIDGDIPIEERELRIDDFANRLELKVLLSSEVGSEGLDLQFASVVFNYDLPWNPMVVEQRIGRIDRIGQESETLTILNLVAEDTVESRILLRLYDRIGIFQDTIGELDPILGESLEQLTIDVLRGALSPEEAERRADSGADALRRQEGEAQRLAQQADALMAADQSFLDEIENLVGRRRIPAPEELQAFSETFFSRNYHGSRIPRDLVLSAGEITIAAQAAVDMRKSQDQPLDMVRVSRLIEGGGFLATFAQSIALRHARAELIHARHPLVQFAYREMNKKHLELHRAFLLKLSDVKRQDGLSELSAGMYAFSIWVFDIPGTRPRIELVSLFISVDECRIVSAEQSDQLLFVLLTHCSDTKMETAQWPGNLPNLRHDLIEASHRYRAELAERERTLNEVRLERRRATLGATLEARISAADTRLKELIAKKAAEFAIRMARLKLQKAQMDKQNRLAEIATGSAFNIEYEEIAAGLVEIS